MITLTASARCIGRCGWTAGPGTQAEADKAAEAHTRKAGHPTATAGRPTTATPATTTERQTMTTSDTRTTAHDEDQADADAPGDGETSVLEVTGLVGTPPRAEPPRRRAMIERAGGE